MKPLPPPHDPGDTEAERFDNKLEVRQTTPVPAGVEYSSQVTALQIGDQLGRVV